jgi:xylulokinase
MGNLILALDIGTTGTKAALVDAQGITQASQYRAYKTRFAPGNFAEQNPDDWWQAAVASIRDLTYGKRDIQQQITAVAISGQMQNLILTKNGDPVRTAIMYNDRRAIDEAETVNKTIGVEKLRQVTGNDQDASSLLSKLLWLKNHSPKSLTDADSLLTGAHDYVVMKLCGESVSDTVTASTTGLLNLVDRTWATELLQALDLPELPLGKLTQGGKVIGQVNAKGAALSGLPKGLPVCHGPGDVGATTLGAGAGEPGVVYGYLGTSGWVGFTSTQRADPEQGVWTLAHPNNDYFIPVAPILTAGGCLEWLREQFKSGGTYAEYTRLAEQAPTSELIFLPYMSGERAPFRDPNARGTFIGISRRTTMNDMFRAVLEGVAFAYRHLLESLGVGNPASVVMTGGGTKSQFWMQLFADILNIPVVIPADPQNVGGRGAALASWVALDHYKNYAPKEYFHYDSRIEPSANRTERYDAYYRVYRDLHKSLGGAFEGMYHASSLK